MTQLVVQKEGRAIIYQAAAVAQSSADRVSFRTIGGEEYSMTLDGNSIEPGTQLILWFPVLPATPQVWTVAAITDDALLMETPEGNKATLAFGDKCMPLDECDSLSADTLES